MTVGQLVRADASLTSVLAERMPVKAKYHLAKLARKMEADLRNYYDRRAELFQEFGTERPATQADVDAKVAGTVGEAVREVSAEKAPEFKLRMDELLSIEVEIDMEPLSIETMGNAEVGDSLLGLGPLLTD